MRRRVAIIGTRPPKDSSAGRAEIYQRLVRDVESFIRALPRDAVIISGGARGIDMVAEEIARELRLSRVVFEPNPLVGTHVEALFARNMQICEYAREVHAWCSPWGTGTQRTMAAAEALGRPVEDHGTRLW